MHYLKLAYLVEIVIVFNLAYIELKWKEEFKKLVDSNNKLGGFGSLILPSAIGSFPPSDNLKRVCNKSKCKKCNNSEYINDKFDNWGLGGSIWQQTGSEPFAFCSGRQSPNLL